MASGTLAPMISGKAAIGTKREQHHLKPKPVYIIPQTAAQSKITENNSAHSPAQYPNLA